MKVAEHATQRYTLGDEAFPCNPSIMAAKQTLGGVAVLVKPGRFQSQKRQRFLSKRDHKGKEMGRGKGPADICPCEA